MESSAPADFNSIAQPTTKHKETTHIPALTGVRFFAVLHIFMFHLWVLFDTKKEPETANLMEGFRLLPEPLITFFSHGWMSTSFFFILSGFILSYLYWGEDGKLVGKRRAFWFKRFARIYPIHLIVLLITFLLVGSWYLTYRSLWEVLPSAIATLFLVQAWFPPWVPEWSWPTWTISALLFLYLIMPWMMSVLAKLNRQQMLILMIVLPFISLIPTTVYAFYFPPGSQPVQNWQIFIGSTPLFWIPQFAGGMLLSRYLGISRFRNQWRPEKSRFFARGDLALLLVIAIAFTPGIEEPFKFFLRHGLMMPLFMLIIVDFARGHGVAARVFSLPGTGFLGETAFSLFIWQNFVMVMLWVTLGISANMGLHQVWLAPAGIVVLASVSTYFIEKPIARMLRRKVKM